MAEQTFEVQPAEHKPERKFLKVYHDFLDTKLLNGKEKMMYILLKRYMDFSLDQNGGADEVYPSLETLAQQSGMSRQTVSSIIKSLEKKKVLKIKKRGLTKPNLYLLQDFGTLWRAGSEEELQEELQTYKEKQLEELAGELGYEVIKKEPVSSTDQSLETSSTNNSTNTDDSTVSNKSQDFERYSMSELKGYFNYDLMQTYIQDGVGQWPNIKTQVELVFNILYDTLNTKKESIRIGQEEKPTMTVVSRLLNLNHECIAYAITKFMEQTGRIQHPIPYMLKLLYNAPEQYRLDLDNLVNYNNYNSEANKEE